MDPHPDQEEQPEARPGSRGGIVAAVVIGAVLLVLVALHLAGSMSIHGT